METSNYWFELQPFTVVTREGKRLLISGDAFAKWSEEIGGSIAYNFTRMNALLLEGEALPFGNANGVPIELSRVLSNWVADVKSTKVEKVIKCEIALQSGRWPNLFSRSSHGHAYLTSESVTTKGGSKEWEAECHIDDCSGEWMLWDDLDYLSDYDVYVDPNVCPTCPNCGEYLPEGRHCESCEVEDYDGEWHYRSDCSREWLRGYGEEWISNYERDNDWTFCEECNEYVRNEEYDFDHDMCYNCWEEQENEEADGPILDYHEHSRTDFVYFGEMDKDGDFVGVGTELEISGNPNSSNPKCEYNQEFAEDLMSTCGLAENECRYETDGSIGDGFEIITEPHTVEDFWSKTKAWETMLETCRKAGFKSHDTGVCGLHVHVSRTMFSKDPKTQRLRIAKVFKFYEKRWDDLLLASRRKNTLYCGRNEVRVKLNNEKVEATDSAFKWREGLAYYESRVSGHHVALNNGNSATFEYRLGRGTLNKASFFAWIDLCLTLTKNSRKSDKKLEDDKEWLKGIRESTARYLVKRNAFVEEMKVLFPSVLWDLDVADSSAA